MRQEETVYLKHVFKQLLPQSGSLPRLMDVEIQNAGCLQVVVVTISVKHVQALVSGLEHPHSRSLSAIFKKFKFVSITFFRTCCSTLCFVDGNDHAYLVTL